MINTFNKYVCILCVPVFAKARAEQVRLIRSLLSPELNLGIRFRALTEASVITIVPTGNPASSNKDVITGNCTNKFFPF